jgi:hypothetical protein
MEIVDVMGSEWKWPQTMCCNCGTRDGVEAQPADLILVRYMLLGGTQWTVKAQLPMCPTCRPTAHRHPKSKGLIAFLAFLVFLPAVWAVSFTVDYEMSGLLVLAIPAVLAIATTQLVEVMSRPAPPRTSRSQPVRIVSLKQEFTTGKVQGARLGFTNAEYAREFRSGNPIARAPAS